MKRWFVYEFLSVAEQRKAAPQWHRSSFLQVQHLALAQPPKTRSVALKCLRKVAVRWCEGSRFRLVLIREEVLDEIIVAAPHTVAAER